MFSHIGLPKSHLQQYPDEHHQWSLKKQGRIACQLLVAALAQSQLRNQSSISFHVGLGDWLPKVGYQPTQV